VLRNLITSCIAKINSHNELSKYVLACFPNHNSICATLFEFTNVHIMSQCHDCSMLHINITMVRSNHD